MNTKFTLFIIPSLLLSLNAIALETDNYLMWNKDLKDSSEKINKFIATQIQEALDSSNKKRKSQDCVDVTNQVARKFMSYFVDKNPLENWLVENLNKDEIYPLNGDYISDSIYRDPFRFYIPAFGLSPNVQINGVYLGTDKLTHFSSTGRRYFNHYLKEIANGANDVQAQKSAILFGLRNEASILGYWSSGVFSYGDVEANYQGFLFYKKMCLDKTQNYLSQDKMGKWSLIELPDIRNYVSPYWDETFNLSYRLPKNWTKVSKVIKEEYCPLTYDPGVIQRMDYYSQFPLKSFSLLFVEKLQKNGYKEAPEPKITQSVSELCSTF